MNTLINDGHLTNMLLLDVALEKLNENELPIVNEIPENDKITNKCNIQSKAKKKTLNDMLKKLAPTILDKSSVEIPAFLKKDSLNSLNNNPNICDSRQTLEPSSVVVKTLNSCIKGVYKCMAAGCDQFFNQVNDLKTHMISVHPDVEQISCSFCFTFLSINTLVEHLSSHIRNVMKCLYCQVTESSREDLLLHLATHHQDKPKKINVCIKILNNERGKQAISAEKPDAKTPDNSFTKIRNRKLAKPIKSQNCDMNDDMEISISAEKFSEKCQQCTYSCLDEKALKEHVALDHTSGNSVLFFRCNICKMSTDIKDIFRNHMSHHLGTQTIRFYSCSYCTIVSNNITIIEDHITNMHPENEFSFQVFQEKIEYLKNIFFCPICNISLIKELYLSHITEAHKLDKLFDFLSSKLSNNDNDSVIKVARSLFRNLLPDAPEQDQMILPNRFTNDNLLDVEKEILANDGSLFSSLINNSTDAYPLSQFYCDKCQYYSNSKTEYADHLKTHSSNECESLIKKLLTQTPVSDASPNNSTLEESVEVSTAQLIAMYGKKVGKSNVFCCKRCPFECSKTVHFRRHLSIHERNESLKEGYKCGYCHFAHNRLNCIKFHLGKYHGDQPYRMSRILHGVELDLNMKDDMALLSKPRPKNRTNMLTSTPVSKQAEDSKRVHDLNGSSINNQLTTSTSIDDLSLIEFEKKLPSLMIYTDPVKCPKCDFTNRVRINIIRHLKMHREENSDNITNDKCYTVSKNYNGDRSSPIEYKLNSCKNGAFKKADASLSESRPLLRSILCDNQSSIKQEPLDTKVESEPESLHSNEEEMNYVTRCNLTTQYKTFSFKIGENYQCNECNFTHRYPSKVKRHFYYKHTKLLPFKCGYCNFGAVESGKVKKHCQLFHRYKREIVIKRNILGKRKYLAPSINIDGAEVINHYVNSKGDDNNGNRWLTQFVTELDNGFKCCKLCGHQADDSQLIHFHVYSAHLTSYPYSCNYCGFAFMDISRTKKHIDTHHEKMPYIIVKRLDELKSNDSDAKMEVGNEDMYDDAPQLDFYPQSSEITNNVASEKIAESKKEFSKVLVSVLGVRKQFKCFYCGIVSKWNRRDIRLHIMHVHMKRRVYTCRYCSFGNSKSKAIVKTHSSKCHPNKAISIRDDLALFNSIIPIEDNKGIVTMAASNDSGTPVTILKNGGEEIPISCDGYDNIPHLTKQSDNASADETEVEYMDSDSASNEAQNQSKNDEAGTVAWKCNMCELIDINEHEVQCHIISNHLSLKAYRCPHCNLYLDEPEQVLAHIEKSHPDKSKHVLSTLKEKAAYLKSSMEVVKILNNADSSEEVEEGTQQTNESIAQNNDLKKNASRYRNGSFKCLLCGYHDPRNDKTKYHVIKTHLNLRQFSCPHCNTYMWGRQQVQKHIEDEHKGKEVVVRRTFEEYEEFLFKNIRKISCSEAAVTKIPTFAISKRNASILRLPCNSCSFVTDSELSLAAHKRSHKIFQCSHCDYKNMLSIRVQNHCQEKHASLPILFKQINSSNFEATRGQLKDLSDGEDNMSQDMFSCDSCSLHFTAEDDLKLHINTMHIGTYVCQQCQIAKFTEESIKTHMKETHPDTPQDFKFIKIDDKLETQEVYEKPPPISSSDGTALFKCSLCNYVSGKLTVMRHHVMSHLRYHPYLCPYCDVIRSVKSFPITKHVKSRHPGKEVKFIYCNNEDLEKQVNESFVRTRTGPTNFKQSDQKDEPIHEINYKDVPFAEYHRPMQRKVLYKCKFCNLKTHIRTDMKHHIMREIQYKPMKCCYCSYTEPCRWSMGKHFRSKHQGIEIKVTEEIIAEKEKEVDKLLEECLIDLKNITEEELRQITASSQNTTFTRVTRSASGIKVPSKLALMNNIYRRQLNSNQCKTVSSFIQKRKFNSSSKVSLKIFKCPHCAYTNTSLKLVRGHMIKHGPHRLQCGYCDYKAHYPSRVRKHTRKHHPGVTFKSVNINVEDAETKSIVVNQDTPLSKSSAISEGIVYIDGVATDITVVPDEKGNFSCTACSYCTQNRELYKMHTLKHMPPKWKCYYCDQHYAIIFRLRRHSNSRHAGQPVKWIENTTGKVFDEGMKPVITKSKFGR